MNDIQAQKLVRDLAGARGGMVVSNDDNGDSDEVVFLDYAVELDSCSAHPKYLSRGIKSLLDNTEQQVSKYRGSTRMVKVPPSNTKTQPFALPANTRNPYTLVSAPCMHALYVVMKGSPLLQMLSAKLGQQVELANLASYLGSSVHLSVSTLLIDGANDDSPIGDGFTDVVNPQGGVFVSALGQIKGYLRTTPNICKVLGKAINDELPGDDMKAVELTQAWPFGLNNKGMFVVTRSDAVSFSDSGGYTVHEHKTKWSPFKRTYSDKPLPRDAKQVLLNACMLAMTTTVSNPLDSLMCKCHYATATSLAGGQGGPTIYTHEFPLGVGKKKGDVLQRAAVSVIGKMKHYADQMFLCENPSQLAMDMWKGKKNYVQYSALYRVCFKNKPPILNQKDIDRQMMKNGDTSWWGGKGKAKLRPKRLQYEQPWHIDHGGRIFENPNQNYLGLAKGGAKTPKPVPKVENPKVISSRLNKLVDKVFEFIIGLESTRLKAILINAIRTYPLGAVDEESGEEAAIEFEIGELRAAAQRGFNATLVALYNPSNMNYADHKHLTQEIYKMFVKDPRADWWSKRYRSPSCVEHIITFVKRDFENMTGAVLNLT